MNWAWPRHKNLLLVGVIEGFAHMLAALIKVDHRVNLYVDKWDSGFRKF